MCFGPLTETHGSAQRGAPEAALPRWTGAWQRRVLREERCPHPQRAAQSGRREARRQSGRPLQRGPAMRPQPPSLSLTSSSSIFSPSPSPWLLLFQRLDGFRAQAITLSIFVCKDPIAEWGDNKVTRWTLNYAMPLLKRVNKNFYLPVKECKHFVLFSNCEITTDWYVIKLVYVYIMAEEKLQII